MMKRLTVCVLVLVLGMLAVMVEARAKPKAREPAIAFVSMGFDDEELVTRLRDYVETNIGGPTRTLTPREPRASSLDKQGEAAASMMSSDDVALVVLVAPKAEIESHTVVLPHKHVVVINTTSLKPEDGAREKYARRLERQVLRGLGVILGLQPCPNPHCVLCTFKSENAIDMMGRAYCPPCSERVQKAAREAGLAPIDYGKLMEQK